MSNVVVDINLVEVGEEKKSVSCCGKESLHFPHDFTQQESLIMSCYPELLDNAQE